MIPMRRNLFLALAFLFLATGAARAQMYDQAWGVKIGVSVADLNVSDAGDAVSPDNQTGLVAGAFVHKYWGILGAQLELNYIEKGAKFDSGIETSSTEITYLEPAALLKAGLPVGIARVGAFGGVGFDFRLSCDTDGEDCGDDVKSTDFTGIVGVDVGVYVGPISVWGDARYNVGLGDINEATDVVGDFKNRAWTFQAGIGFPFGG
jgi:hypothetical protein